jgi:hypothetical protein
MKTLTQQICRAFNALEFANVSQLNELNARLHQGERAAPPARAPRRNAGSDIGTGTVTVLNSPC